MIYSEYRVLLDALDIALRTEFQVGTVHSCDCFLTALGSSTTDLAVVGLSRPVDEGSRVLEVALERRPELPILLLSMDGTSVNPRYAAQLGAKAYCDATQPLHRFVSDIDRLLSGESLIEESAPAKALSTRPTVQDLLTARQIEVLRLIANGAGAKEIANELNIAVRTAEFHRAAIMDRLDLRTTAQMTRYALQNGIG